MYSYLFIGMVKAKPKFKEKKQVHYVQDWYLYENENVFVSAKTFVINFKILYSCDRIITQKGKK